jgi:hypothetical protein
MILPFTPWDMAGLEISPAPYSREISYPWL